MATWHHNNKIKKIKIISHCQVAPLEPAVLGSFPPNSMRQLSSACSLQQLHQSQYGSIWLYRPTWNWRKVPSPPTFWLLGHLHLLAKHGPDVFMQLAHKYGPIYRFQFLNSPSVLQFQFFHTLSGEISCFVTYSVIHIHQLHLLTMSMLTVVNWTELRKQCLSPWRSDRQVRGIDYLGCWL